MRRKRTKQVMVGSVPVGGGAPITVQSMTNTKTVDVAATIEQIHRLEDAGCEIVRVSVPDKAAAAALSEIKKAVTVPLVADIHFKWELAVAALEAGADKVRINPGNIRDKRGIAAIAAAAARRGVPIRIGVNSGSLTPEIRQSDMSPAAKLAASALAAVRLMESYDFTDLIISVKSFQVPETIEANKLVAAEVDYPLHIGITESGTLESGSIRSAVGLSVLLAAGIGDTMRVSLSADPVAEVLTAQRILQALEVRKFHPELVSCPTCARCQVNLIPMAREVEERLKNIDSPLRVAVMGCVVNGPGEAGQADMGIAAGRGWGVLFNRGQVVKRIPEDKFVEELLRLVESRDKEES